MIGMEANTMMVCSKASFFGKGTGTVALNRANELGRHTKKKQEAGINGSLFFKLSDVVRLFRYNFN